jgi:hypothetical protein
LSTDGDVAMLRDVQQLGDVRQIFDVTHSPVAAALAHLRAFTRVSLVSPAPGRGTVRKERRPFLIAGVALTGRSENGRRRL